MKTNFMTYQENILQHYSINKNEVIYRISTLKDLENQTGQYQSQVKEIQYSVLRDI
jgi:hypothetical protein